MLKAGARKRARKQDCFVLCVVSAYMAGAGADGGVVGREGAGGGGGGHPD